MCPLNSGVFLPQTAMQKIGYKDGLQKELLKKRYNACYNAHVHAIVAFFYRDDLMSEVAKLKERVQALESR